MFKISLGVMVVASRNYVTNQVRHLKDVMKCSLLQKSPTKSTGNIF